MITWAQLNALEEEIKDVLCKNSICGTALIKSDDSSLTALGITKIGHRRKILKLLRELEMPLEQKMKAKGNGSLLFFLSAL